MVVRKKHALSFSTWANPKQRLCRPDVALRFVTVRRRLRVAQILRLARIQSAIKHRNESELRWAVEYCRMRLAQYRARGGEYTALAGFNIPLSSILSVMALFAPV